MISPKIRQILAPYRNLLFYSTLVQVIFSALGLAMPWILKISIDKVLPSADYNVFIIMAVAILGLYILRSIMRYMSGYLGTYTSVRILLDIRSKIFKHLQSLSLRFYEEYRAGKLISNVISDVALLQQLVTICITLSDQIFSALVIFVIMIFFNWKLTLIVAAFIPLHALNFIYFRKILQKESLNLQEKMSEVSANLSESINGIKVVKSFARERSVIKQFFGTMRPTIDMHLNININSNICGAISEILTVITYLCVIFFSIPMVKSGSLSLGDFAAFYVYTGLLLGPISAISNVSSIIAQGSAGAIRISNLLSVIPEIKECAEPIVAGRLKGDVVFKNINFKYKNTPVIKNFSLDIKAGEKVALVGPSGCGKSTASNLLLRFYEVEDGSLTVDGIEVKRYAIESYHNNIGVVLQEPFLFSGTIYDNIAFSKLNPSEDEVRHAARLANVEEFVMRLPHGYNTIIGENGSSLSGGQKQRIAIARAILKNPAILILDEATSALDTVSEHIVQEALDNVMRGRTTIIIAHRLSTIKNADKIIVMREGVIQQSGTHDELLGQDGIYKDLYITQKKVSV